MSVGLDPIVAAKLKQFGRRRLRLILARGIAAGMVTFLLAISFVAAIDWFWLLSDRMRWCLSTGAYLAVVVAVWWTCLRRLAHRPISEEIAAQVEQVEPELREHLRSAVELAAEDPAAIHDSLMFRGLLQGKVAELMARVRVPRLLPFRLVARWVVAAAVLIAIAAALLTSGDGRFRQLASRAILPGANIARVSRIQVEILAPTPHSLRTAEDETVAVIVAVTGGEVDEVTLETFTAGQGSVRQTMNGRSDSEFSANIHVADESVEYRILAGDAVTQRFRIDAHPRPRVLAFHKTYSFPEYAGLPARTVTETQGDLLVLEGTTTDLVLDLDQTVSLAEIRIEYSDSGETQVIPLLPVAAQVEGKAGLSWQAAVPVDKAAIYQVHLVSKETGFENRFSPKYEIRPQPDLIPRAGFVNQQETTLLLPPNDILALQAMAEDDLPLVSLEQHVSVNGEDWLSIPLTVELMNNAEGNQVTADWQWDLLEHRLKEGDQLTTKLVATDRKGNTGESVPLRIIVAAQDFDPQRNVTMELKASLYDSLADLADLLEEHRKSALEILARLRTGDRSPQEIALDRTTLIDLAARQREQAGLVLRQIKDIERQMPAGADAYDLELTGRVIARLEHEHANSPAYLLRAIEHTTDENRIKADLDELQRTFQRTADDAQNVARHYRTLVTHNFYCAVAFDLDALLRQQQLIANSPTQTWQRLVRQETIVTNQFRELERLVRNQRDRLNAGRLDPLLRWADQQRIRLEEAMESEDKLPELQRVAQDMVRQLEQNQRVDVIDGGLPGQLTGIRRDLENRSGSLYVPLFLLGRAMLEENRLTAQASESEDSAAGRELLDQAERFVAEIDLKHAASLEQFRTRRALTQTRPDADTQYAADAGLTHRAARALLGQHRQVAPQESKIPEHFQDVAPAYRTLEAGHQLMIARGAVEMLLSMERWGAQSIQSHLDHPRQWDTAQWALELASQRLREAGVDAALIARLDALRSSAVVNEAARKITQRRWKRDRIVGAGHEILEIQTELAAVVESIQPAMADARAVIAQYAPSIPELARQTAEQLRELEEATTTAADRIEDPQTPDAEQQLAQLQDQQQAINEQLEDLFDALVEDANTQDVLDDEERERARDADASVQLIRKPAAEMNKALQAAHTSDETRRQATELARAAEQQEKTAEALDLVAEHFDRLDQGLEVAESRSELRPPDSEAAAAGPLTQPFTEAEELARMANQDAQQLLAELEQELQRNPAMQQALSEIARDTLEEARNELQAAAETDANLQKQNEQADAEFRARKKDLAEDLRKLASEASKLNNTLVAQANQAAALGKAPEAQAKFNVVRQKLNEAIGKANAAREDQLLGDLATAAREARDKLSEATEVLKEAEDIAEAARENPIHANDQARENARKAAETRRKQFFEQQKRTARDEAKRASDAQRREDQNVRNTENQVRNAERQLQQAQNNLKRKPEDQGLQRAVAQMEAAKAVQEQRLAAAREAQREAAGEAEQLARRSDEINRKPQPPLNAANPEAELSDQLADEAIALAEQLNATASELAAASEFGEELQTPQNQLATAAQQQQMLTEDVRQVADDVARAARHERRLNNMQAAEPLQQAANEIQAVAQNESTNAEQQLAEAATEAQQNAAANAAQQDPAGANAAEPNPGDSPQGTAAAASPQSPMNTEVLKAQGSLAQAEQALSQQAEQLNNVLEPLLAAAEAAAAQQAGQPAGLTPGDAAQAANAAQQPQGQAGNPGNDQAPMPAGAESAATDPGAAGEAASGPGQPAVPLTPEQLARGQQLARTLDELDRQQAAAALAQQTDPGQPVPATATTAANLPTLAQAAQAQQAALAAARAQAQQQAMLALGESGTQSSDAPAATGPQGEFTLGTVDRNEKSDWGKLRKKSAEDVGRGRSEAVAEEYRQSVETYFRVLAERARKK